MPWVLSGVLYFSTVSRWEVSGTVVARDGAKGVRLTSQRVGGGMRGRE